MSLASRLPATWRQPLLALVLLLLGLLLIYGQTAWSMVSIWARSDTYAHGFVVPLISLWLVWRQRHALVALNPVPARLAWLLLLAAALLWLAGDLVSVNVITQLAFVTMLVLAVPVVLGWQVTRALTFPLGFMFFAVPLGDFMLPQLMEWTADFTVLALRLSGVPVYREGLQFVIPSGTWSVVEACSGIRYLIASLTVGCLFAYLSYSSNRKRWLFMLVALLVPVIANWLRAYLIVMMGHLSGNALATGVDHLIYGWLFFGFIITVMLFIGSRWTDPLEAAPLPPYPPDWLPDEDAATPGSPLSASFRAAVLALGIGLLPQGFELALTLGTSARPVQLVSVKAQSGWDVSLSDLSDWRPAFPSTSADAHDAYADAQGHLVGVHLAYFRQQNYGRKLVSSENMLVHNDDPLWARVSTGQDSATLAGQPLKVDTAVLRENGQGLAHTGQRLLVWRFYWVNGEFTASDHMAKVLGALSRLKGQGDDAAIVVVYTPLNPQLTSTEAGAAVLQSFLTDNGIALATALQQTRGRD